MLFHQILNLSTPLIIRFLLPLKDLKSQLKHLRKVKSQAYRKVAGASRAENIIETANPSTVEKNTETTGEVIQNSKADTIVAAKDKKGYLLAAKGVAQKK